MFLEESYWIKMELQKMKDIKNVIDVGSSTLQFRTIRQPYIEKNIFKPLKDQYVNVYHLDIKNQNGVEDISKDISNKLFYINKKFDLVICANILEHIKDIDIAVANLPNLINDNGYLIVTIPYVYPYHPDPIDNMLRPDIDDLKILFKDKFNVVSTDIINIRSRKFFNRFIFGGCSIINILIDMKFEYLNGNIRKHILRKPKVVCITFKKR